MSEGKQKILKSLDIAVICLAVGLGLFQLFSASYGTWMSYVLAAVHWGFIATYIVIRKHSKFKFGWIYDIIIAGLTLYVCCYQVILQNRMVTSAGIYSTLDVVVAVIAALVVIDVGRRVVGNILPVIVAVFLLYSYFGHAIPGVVGTVPFTIKRIAMYLFTSGDGIFGTTLYVSAKYIFLFILFGSFMELTGAGKFFVDLAYAAVGKARGGPAQAAVFSSMLMGTINGSGAANVATVGTFTIPLMKKVGIAPRTAGAIETVASSGGQIMPPVMGAVAFLMAELTGITYAKIALAALVPALLYYSTLSFSIYFIARRDNLGSKGMEEREHIWEVLKHGWLFLVPLAVLIILLIKGFSVQMSAFYSILLSIAIGFVKNRKEMTIKNFITVFEKAIAGIGPVAAACALAGIIMGTISLTGLGLKISGIIESLAGGNLILALLLSMIASLILGMGLPTSPAYLMLAILVAPALIEMGVSTMAAHLFLLYFGALSTITPPVALSTFAAAGIAGAGVWEVGVDAIKLASAGFIIPFIFAYNNSLLLMGPVDEVIITIVTALLGCMVLAMSVSGWMLRKLTVIPRLILLVASVCLIVPQVSWSAVGLAVAVVTIFVSTKLTSRKSNDMAK